MVKENSTVKTHNINPFKKAMLGYNILYAITINPDDQHQYYDEGPNRLVKFYKYWERQFRKYNWEYSLYVESSTPNKVSFTSRPRYHFHGIIYFKKRQLSAWYNTISIELSKTAHTDIDILTDYGIWKDYCSVNATLMNKCFLPKDLHNPIQSISYSNVYKPKVSPIASGGDVRHLQSK